MKFRLFVVGLCLLGCVSQAGAEVMNGGFEMPFTSSDWTVTGTAARETYASLVTTPGSIPIEGMFQVSLLTHDISDGSGGGASSTPVADLETIVGLAAGSLSNLGAFNGSAITQLITGNIGDRLQFHYDFYTAEVPFGGMLDTNDFAFVAFNGMLFQLPSAVANPLPTGMPIPPPSIAATGYLLSPAPSEFTLTSTGPFLLAFGVVNVDVTGSGDRSAPSGLAIDDVRLLPQMTPTPIPEPGSVILLGSGLLGVVLWRHYRRTRQSWLT